MDYAFLLSTGSLLEKLESKFTKSHNMSNTKENTYAHSENCQAPKIERFAKPLNIFVKRSILDL